jgi:hypothetical protein
MVTLDRVLLVVQVAVIDAAPGVVDSKNVVADTKRV